MCFVVLIQLLCGPNMATADEKTMLQSININYLKVNRTICYMSVGMKRLSCWWKASTKDSLFIYMIVYVTQSLKKVKNIKLNSSERQITYPTHEQTDCQLYATLLTTVCKFLMKKLCTLGKISLTDDSISVCCALFYSHSTRNLQQEISLVE